MRRVTLDNTSDDNNSIHVCLTHHTCCAVSQFYGTGHVDYIDIIHRHPVFGQCLNGSERHRISDVVVPVRYYNSIALTSEDLSARQLSSIILR